MSFENMPDDRLTLFYENVRQQVDADGQLKYPFMAGPTVREHADKLRDEMVKRRLQHLPIDWPVTKERG